MSEHDKPEAKRTRLGVGDHVAKPLPELVGRVVLDRYLIEAKLGSGAMGSVFRGKHVKLARNVAIKVLHEQFVDDPTMLQRFRREALVAARLHHANVVGVLDVGETDGMQLMVMELALGPTLHDLMKGPMARDAIIHMVRSLLNGLDHAHAAGLIHRDLKPDNVIVESTASGDVPRIVDFGIALLRDPDDSIEGGKLTGSGVIIGTPIYMAPEQAKGDEIDHRVDLFALGVMMYEMLAGAQPFSGTAMEIAIANINSDPPPIVRRVPGLDVDPILELYARKLMARKVAARFGSAHEALEVLALVERDPEAAALVLGRMDVAKAFALISLPSPPR